MKITFIEIPVKDIERALSFYTAAFALGPIEIDRSDPVRTMAILYYDEAGVLPGISLNQTANFEPGANGPLAYIRINDLEAHIQRAQAAGGSISAGKTAMGEWGFYAMIQDTEGNTYALSQQA